MTAVAIPAVAKKPVLMAVIPKEVVVTVMDDPAVTAIPEAAADVAVGKTMGKIVGTAIKAVLMHISQYKKYQTKILQVTANER